MALDIGQVMAERRRTRPLLADLMDGDEVGRGCEARQLHGQSIAERDRGERGGRIDRDRDRSARSGFLVDDLAGLIPLRADPQRLSPDRCRVPVHRRTRATRLAAHVPTRATVVDVGKEREIFLVSCHDGTVTLLLRLSHAL